MSNAPRAQRQAPGSGSVTVLGDRDRVVATAKTQPMRPGGEPAWPAANGAPPAAGTGGGLGAALRRLSDRFEAMCSRPDPSGGPGSEFRPARAWLLATVCGLLGLSLVLVALTVAGRQVPPPPPPVPATAPATELAPPPPAPAEAEAGQPAPSTPGKRSAPPARSGGGSTSGAGSASGSGSDSDSDDDSDSNSDSNSDSPHSWTGYDHGPGWGSYGQGSDMARDLMRYRMNSEYPSEHGRQSQPQGQPEPRRQPEPHGQSGHSGHGN